MKVLLALLSLSCIATAGQAGSATLWIPEQMITGETYHGVIILNDATSGGTLALLSTSDGTVAQIQQSIPVLPHQNHGIFPITPQNP